MLNLSLSMIGFIRENLWLGLKRRKYSPLMLTAKIKMRKVKVKYIT
jgi:hypothetical protein